MGPSWGYVVQTATTGILTSLVLLWLASTRKGAGECEGRFVLTTTRALPAIGIVCSALFVAAAIACYFSESGGVWLATGFLGFASLGIPLILEGRVRHELDEHGIRYRGLFKKAPHVPWNDLRFAKYRPVAKWLEVETSNHGKLRFSSALKGWDILANALRVWSPLLVMDNLAHQVLEDARHGTPPSLWN